VRHQELKKFSVRFSIPLPCDAKSELRKNFPQNFLENFFSTKKNFNHPLEKTLKTFSDFFDFLVRKRSQTIL
jgi:hypothetical protein